MTMATIEAQPQKPQLSPPPPPHESTPVATVTTPTTKKEHIFRSRLSDIPISNHLPLHTYCFNKLPECANRPCLIVGSTGKIYTYAETHFLCRRTAAGLSKLGVKKGDVVMTLLQNCPEFVFSFFGASMIAAVSTTANPFYTPAEIFKQLAASKAKVIITHSQYVEKLRQSPDDINTSFPVFGKDFTVVTVDAPPENCLPFSVLSESNEADLPQVSIEPNDAVALPFSSGTTGLPKGVILTHRSLITGVAQNVDGENPNFYFNQDDVVLCLLPLFHIYSLSSVMLCSLRSGSRMVIMQKFEVGALLEQIQRHKVTVAAVVPPVVLMLAKNNEMAEKFDLSSIRAVLSGAAPLGKELEDALRSRVPQAVLGQGYGMTEAGPVLSMCPGLAKDPLPNKPGSCGIIVRNAEMKVVHPETGCSLGYNQQGEICIRGHQVMKGYLNDSKATTAIIDEEGWLHTGDIGYVDDDGYVFIVDRIKEIIKYKGFQVAPAELEALLLNHPSIADAAVVPQKDEAAGEVPVAFVVPTKGFELSEEEVRQFIAKQVVFYKKLHKVYFVDSIAKSLAGKILRKELRAKLTS